MEDVSGGRPVNDSGVHLRGRIAATFPTDEQRHSEGVRGNPLLGDAEIRVRA
jgi:hypothetical protein